MRTTTKDDVDDDDDDKTEDCLCECVFISAERKIKRLKKPQTYALYRAPAKNNKQ